jgi:hypothetical protein
MKTINLIIDTHHWVAMILDNNNKNPRYAKPIGSAARVLNYINRFGKAQPFRAIWTDHNAFGVKTVLRRSGWSEDQVKSAISFCEKLATDCGGSHEEVDYVAQAKVDPEMANVLDRFGGLYNAPDWEDAGILKMGMDFHADFVISNDAGVRVATAPILVRTIEALEASITGAIKAAPKAA